MDYLPCRRLVAAAMTVLAFSAPAQETVIFSKPTDVSAEKANAFLPGANHRIGDFNAPHPLFNDYTPDLPMPKPVPLNNNDAAVKEALNKRKNWTLLTPEQILGVQTPEQILGVPDKNAGKKLTLEEQYLLRESQSSLAVATNGQAGATFLRESANASPFDGNSKNEANAAYRGEPQKMETVKGFFNQLWNNAQQNLQTEPDQKPNSPWNSVFTQPSKPKPTPEQLADMDRFRALMEPSSPPDGTPVATRFSEAPAPAPDPFLQPAPVVNPAGRAITPLANEFSQPAGIKPLPGISTPPPAPVATKPGWQAQLPPWMKNGPPAQNPNQGF